MNEPTKLRFYEVTVKVIARGHSVADVAKDVEQWIKGSIPTNPSYAARSARVVGTRDIDDEIMG
jgi:hypothetical protein